MSLILDGSPPDSYWDDPVASCETWEALEAWEERHEQEPGNQGAA